MCTRVTPMLIGEPSRSRADPNTALRRERLIELRDLVALRKVGIEVVLAREDRRRVHRRSRARARRAIASSTACAFSTGSAPGSARHTGQVFAFGGVAEVGRAAAEDLRRRLELHVHLEADDHLVALVCRRGRQVIGAPRRRGRARARTPRRTSVARRNAARCNWPPTGSPSTRPIGTDIAGTPARFAVAVKMSLRYISYGSDFAPSGNAVVGVVGVKSRCDAASRTPRRSRAAISARTCCAFR